MTLFASRKAPTPESPTVTPLEVIRLDRSTWRISNAAVDPSDPARIMGFIERLERERFEVLLLVLPIGWAYVENFGQALLAFSDRERFRGVIEPQREHALEGGANPRPPRS